MGVAKHILTIHKHLKQMVRRVRSSQGETLVETLVSILIGGLSIMMLAGAITAAVGIISRSRDDMTRHYNDEIALVNESVTSYSGTLTLQETSGGTGVRIDESIPPASVTVYVDSTTSSVPIARY